MGFNLKSITKGISKLSPTNLIKAQVKIATTAIGGASQVLTAATGAVQKNQAALSVIGGALGAPPGLMSGLGSLGTGDTQAGGGFAGYAQQTAPASPGGSNTTLYLVIGGVAILGVFLMMRSRS